MLAVRLRVHSGGVEPRLPQNFGRYILRERVGRGGMAEVFRASLPGFGGFEKPVAIKRMFREFSHDAAFVEMLNDEAKIVSQLAHPNIVQILDVGRVGDEYYIAFEYLEGVDLFSVLQRHHEEQRDLPAGLACYIVAELCSALDYAHSRHTADGKPLGIIHRDVSPQNVLLSLVGEVKLTDFGIAKAAYRYTQTQAGLIKGKIYYMSPEQVLGQELDHRSDLFAAGILLFECLTTRPLYDEPDQKRLLDRVSRAQMTWPADKVGRVPPALRQVVEKALQARPADRYATGKEMRTALTTAAHDLGLWWEREQLGAYLRQMYSVAEDRPPDVRVHERLVHPERHDARWNSQVDAKAHSREGATKGEEAGAKRDDTGDEATWRDPALPPRLPSWGPAGPKVPPPRASLAQQPGPGPRETAPPPLPTPPKAPPSLPKTSASPPSPPARSPAPPQALQPPPMPASLPAAPPAHAASGAARTVSPAAPAAANAASGAVRAVPGPPVAAANAASGAARAVPLPPASPVSAAQRPAAAAGGSQARQVPAAGAPPPIPQRDGDLLAQTTVPGKPGASSRSASAPPAPPPLPPAPLAESPPAPSANEPDNPTFELAVLSPPSLPPAATAATGTGALPAESLPPPLAERPPTPPPGRKTAPPPRPPTRASSDRQTASKAAPPPPAPPQHEDATFQMDQAELTRRLAEQPSVLPPEESTRALPASSEGLDDTTKPQTSRQEPWAVRTQPAGASADDLPEDDRPASRLLLFATAVVWVGAVTLAVYATLITVRGSP